MAPMNKGWIRFYSSTHTFWYQMTGGIIGNKIFGVPVLLLTATGRKSGRKHTLPLMHLRDGDNYILIASYAGHDVHPAWYLNLRANPDAEIQIGREKFRVRAETANDEDRERLYARAVEVSKDYAEYQKQTKRKIPVVILRPVA
jgi:deazaflavin-dependent oxidoreductase (nitroreductase family)